MTSGMPAAQASPKSASVPKSQVSRNERPPPKN